MAGRLASRDVVARARAVAARGGRCEIVGTAPPDASGDRLLLALATAGVGHAAVLRSPAPDLDAADLELALWYLPDARVVVLAGAPELAGAAARVTDWSGATLIVVRPDEANESTAAGAGLTDGDANAAERGDPIVLAQPTRDPDGAFSGLVADLALRLDAGEPPAAAWSATLAALQVEPAG